MMFLHHMAIMSGHSQIINRQFRVCSIGRSRSAPRKCQTPPKNYSSLHQICRKMQRLGSITFSRRSLGKPWKALVTNSRCSKWSSQLVAVAPVNWTVSMSFTITTSRTALSELKWRLFAQLFDGDLRNHMKLHVGSWPRYSMYGISTYATISSIDVLKIKVGKYSIHGPSLLVTIAIINHELSINHWLTI